MLISGQVLIIFYSRYITRRSNKCLGIFYIVGQLFVNSLQLVIVPMVFTSIALAMCKISDTKKLGRISYKTILGFLSTSVFALALAGVIGFIIKNLGLFTANVENVTAQAGVVSSRNPLLIIVQAIPNNILSAFSTNSSILAVVFVAVVLGLCINYLGDKVKCIKNFIRRSKLNHNGIFKLYNN